MFGQKKKEQTTEVNLSVAGGPNDLMSSFFPPVEERTDMAEVIDKLNIKDKDQDLLKKLTELNHSQIMAISILTTAAETYNIPTLKKIIAEYMSLMISKSRHGRKEIIDLFGKGQQQPPFIVNSESGLAKKIRG